MLGKIASLKGKPREAKAEALPLLFSKALAIQEVAVRPKTPCPYKRRRKKANNKDVVLWAKENKKVALAKKIEFSITILCAGILSIKRPKLNNRGQPPFMTNKKLIGG